MENFKQNMNNTKFNQSTSLPLVNDLSSDTLYKKNTPSKKRTRMLKTCVNHSSNICNNNSEFLQPSEVYKKILRPYIIPTKEGEIYSDLKICPTPKSLEKIKVTEEGLDDWFAQNMNRNLVTMLLAHKNFYIPQSVSESLHKRYKSVDTAAKLQAKHGQLTYFNTPIEKGITKLSSKLIAADPNLLLFDANMLKPLHVPDGTPQKIEINSQKTIIDSKSDNYTGLNSVKSQRDEVNSKDVQSIYDNQIGKNLVNQNSQIIPKIQNRKNKLEKKSSNSSTFPTVCDANRTKKQIFKKSRSKRDSISMINKIPYLPHLTMTVQMLESNENNNEVHGSSDDIETAKLSMIERFSNANRNEADPFLNHLKKELGLTESHDDHYDRNQHINPESTMMDQSNQQSELLQKSNLIKDTMHNTSKDEIKKKVLLNKLFHSRLKKEVSNIYNPIVAPHEIRALKNYNEFRQNLPRVYGSNANKKNILLISQGIRSPFEIGNSIYDSPGTKNNNLGLDSSHVNSNSSLIEISNRKDSFQGSPSKNVQRTSFSNGFNNFPKVDNVNSKKKYITGKRYANDLRSKNSNDNSYKVSIIHEQLFADNSSSKISLDDDTKNGLVKNFFNSVHPNQPIQYNFEDRLLDTSIDKKNLNKSQSGNYTEAFGMNTFLNTNIRTRDNSMPRVYSLNNTKPEKGFNKSSKVEFKNTKYGSVQNMNRFYSTNLKGHESRKTPELIRNSPIPINDTIGDIKDDITIRPDSNPKSRNEIFENNTGNEGSSIKNQVHKMSISIGNVEYNNQGFLSKKKNGERDNVEFWFLRGMIQMKKNSFYNAIDCFKQVLSLDPKNYLSIFNIGCIYERLSNFDLAKKWLKLTLDLNFCVKEALYAHALCDFKMSNFYEAYQKLIKLEKMSDQLQINVVYLIALCSKEMKDFNRAKEYYRILNDQIIANLYKKLTSIIIGYYILCKKNIKNQINHLLLYRFKSICRQIIPYNNMANTYLRDYYIDDDGWKSDFIDYILNALRNLSFWKRFSNELLKKFLKHMKVKLLPSNAVYFLQDNEVCIILKGIIILRDHANNFLDPYIMSIYSEGDIFGYDNIDRYICRKVEVWLYTLSNVELIVMNKNNFYNLWNLQNEMPKYVYINFISNIDMFKNLSEQIIYKMVFELFFKEYKYKDQVIYNDNSYMTSEAINQIIDINYRKHNAIKQRRDGILGIDKYMNDKSQIKLENRFNSNDIGPIFLAKLGKFQPFEARGIYIIVKGECIIEHYDGSIMAILSTGDYFGEKTLLSIASVSDFGLIKVRSDKIELLLLSESMYDHIYFYEIDNMRKNCSNRKLVKMLQDLNDIKAAQKKI